MRYLLRIGILLVVSSALASCVKADRNLGRALSDMTAGGHPYRGRQLIHEYGCGSCHQVPGVPGAAGLIGPPLRGVGNRMVIAGVLPNVPGNMIRWIKDAPSIDSMTVMPDMGVSEQEARDIAAYLYTLR